MMTTVKPLAMRTDDQGELEIKVTHDPSGQIIIDFGKEIHWIAFDRDTARRLAMLVLSAAADSVANYIIGETKDD